MNRVTWIMRPAASIETPQVRNGRRAIITLACGHVIVWRASRLKSYKPARWRCAECHELLEEFLSENCEQIVERMEGTNNDKQIHERAARRIDSRGSGNLHGTSAEHVQRRFLRCD